MNTYIKPAFIIALSLTSLSACFDKDNDTEIPLTDVPANIINIVQNTLPGISLTEAEKSTHNDSVIYELEGNLISGEKYEIKITESGSIIKIELDD